MRRLVAVCLTAAALAACASFYTQMELQGNNTGGVIPAQLVAKGNVQGQASEHCAKYGRVAKITFTPDQAGASGSVVFICEAGAPPAGPPPVISAQPPPIPPAKKGSTTR